MTMLPTRARLAMTDIRKEIDRTVSGNIRRSVVETMGALRSQLETMLAQARWDRRIASHELYVNVDPYRRPDVVQVSVFVKPIHVAPFIPINIDVSPYGQYDVRVETRIKP